MKSNIYEEWNEKYFDCYLYITPYQYLSTEFWRRCVSLDTEYGTIHEGPWFFSAQIEDVLDETDRTPPIEVMREYSRRYPEMMAIIMRERLNGTSG